MGKLLDSVKSREELVRLNTEQLNILANEIREYIIDITAKNGGHLASNLGAVELTIALHRVLRLPKDKLVWDVGHQSYTHKTLSGRRNELEKLRKIDGASGFCDPEESDFDSYVSGHTSTSLSLALGAACARDTLGEKYNVAAVIGDGAMTGGMAMEAMNNIGHEAKKMLIVLNDNEMSISKNVGAMSSYLMRARTSAGYTRSKQGVEDALDKIPVYGKKMADVIRKAKNHVKYLVSPGVLFEEMGITYLGPIDGHNIRLMEDTFRRALKLNEPVMVHVVTRKGKGYLPAEREPQKYHGVGCFDKSVGVKDNKNETYSSVFGDEMCKLAEKNNRLAVITPAMTLGSGLKEFAAKFPDRFYDVGIAEAHAVTFAGGLAGAKMIPVAAIYSTFAQRAYDSVIHDIAAGNLHAVLAIDRAGLVPGDGKTHQGIFDIAYLSAVPNLVILSPCSFDEQRKMLRYAVEEHDGPIAVRYPRGGAQCGVNCGNFELGKAFVAREGIDLSILAEGTTLGDAMKAADILFENGISAEVINARTIKPLDIETIEKSVKKTGRFVSLEQGIKTGGMGGNACASLNERNVIFKAIIFAVESFVTHGTYEEIQKAYKLDADSIADKIMKEWFKLEDKA